MAATATAPRVTREMIEDRWQGLTCTTERATGKETNSEIYEAVTGGIRALAAGVIHGVNGLVTAREPNPEYEGLCELEEHLWEVITEAVVTFGMDVESRRVYVE